MAVDAGGVLGLVLVVVLLWVVLSPVVFRLFVLPAYARRRGWRARGVLAGHRPEGDLPGDGSQGWETPLPGMMCEFLGTHGGRPVHGIEVSVTRRYRHDPLRQRGKMVRYYSVVTMAVSDRPFANFNAGRRGTVVNGDPMAFYPDFVDWARNRKVPDAANVVQEDAGMRSISWFGHMSRRRMTRALDELAGTA